MEILGEPGRYTVDIGPEHCQWSKHEYPKYEPAGPVDDTPTPLASEVLLGWLGFTVFIMIFCLYASIWIKALWLRLWFGVTF